MVSSVCGRPEACYLFSNSIEEDELKIIHSEISDKDSILKKLEEMPLEDLWDNLLKNQVKLLFPHEQKMYDRMDWWLNARDVLDIGCGNGEYLNALATAFGGKRYVGMEKEQGKIKVADERFTSPTVSFVEGDAEVLYPSHEQKYDVVLFRLTLQHVLDPLKALENATRYLKPNGVMFIVESLESVADSSCSSPHMTDVFKQISLANKEKGVGNRLISAQMLLNLQGRYAFPGSDFKIANNFELLSTNLHFDDTFRFTGESERLEWGGDRDRILYAKNQLYILHIAKKGIWQLPLDSSFVSGAYDEVKCWVDDENAHGFFGTHMLALKKIV